MMRVSFFTSNRWLTNLAAWWCVDLARKILPFAERSERQWADRDGRGHEFAWAFRASCSITQLVLTRLSYTNSKLLACSTVSATHSICCMAHPQPSIQERAMLVLAMIQRVSILRYLHASYFCGNCALTRCYTYTQGIFRCLQAPLSVCSPARKRGQERRLERGQRGYGGLCGE